MQGVQQHPRYRVTAPVGLVTPSGDVEEFALEDISLGGVFIRTLLPAPAGSVVRIRLPIDRDGDREGEQRALSLRGRVVHVIDEESSLSKARAPGMGVQFDGLSHDARRSLEQFVEALVAGQHRERMPRFVDADHVVVPDDRPALARIWAAGLDRGTLVARGQARLGNRVIVTVGLVTLAADVIAIDGSVSGGAATLRVVDLKGPKRAALEAIVDRRGPPAAPIAVDMGLAAIERDLEEVLAEAQQLSAALEADSLPALIGTPIDDAADADGAEVSWARVASTSDVFAPFAEEARPRSSAAPNAANKMPLSEDEREALAELFAEAEFLETAGRPEEAQTTLLDAREIAPDNTGVNRRLAKLADEMDAASARALLDDAEAMPRTERVKRAQKATRLSSSREVLLRAMRMLATAGAHDDMLAVAEHLAELFPDDELPLFAIMQVNERGRRWAAAARAGEALLRLRPDDYELHERVGQLAAAARADG